VLRELYSELVQAMEDITPEFEIIFVEDCGGDGSWPIIADLARHDPRVRGLRMSRNYGQHNALLCGIRAAQYDVIVTMDDDLQHPVSEIRKLLLALTPDFDVVYGTPLEEQHGLLRDIASRLTKLALTSAMGARTAASVSAFRAFRTRLRDGFSDYRSPNVSIDVLLTWSTARFTSIKVRHAPRTIGVSGYSVTKLLRHALNLMTGFSVLPLQVASVAGFSFVIFGFSILMYVLFRYFIYGSAVPGFAFLACMTAIFSGVQLFALGIFGEYLARIYLRSMDRPPYLVQDVATIGLPLAVGGDGEAPEITESGSRPKPRHKAASVTRAA
jgi:undecaprenyl-phosphate 4-deoxy-4-formamido-L-arabinose transferase